MKTFSVLLILGVCLLAIAFAQEGEDNKDKAEPLKKEVGRNNTTKEKPQKPRSFEGQTPQEDEAVGKGKGKGKSEKSEKSEGKGNKEKGTKGKENKETKGKSQQNKDGQSQGQSNKGQSQSQG